MSLVMAWNGRANNQMNNSKHLLFIVAINDIFIICGNEADKDGFVPGIQMGIWCKGGGIHGTAAAKGDQSMTNQMSTLPEDYDDRRAADGV